MGLRSRDRGVLYPLPAGYGVFRGDLMGYTSRDRGAILPCSETRVKGKIKRREGRGNFG